MNRSTWRPWSLLCLVSLLAQLVPFPTASSAAPVAPSALSGRQPSLNNAPPPANHRPAAAQSTVAPAAMASTVAAGIEENHLLNDVGTFSGDTQREVLTGPAVYTVPGGTYLDFPYTIPAYMHDSFKVDLRFQRAIYNSVNWETSALIEVKPVTGTVWFQSSSLLAHAEPEIEITPVKTVHVTISHNRHMRAAKTPTLDDPVHTLPENVPMQLRLRCNSAPSGDLGWCEFSNFRFFEDAPTWRRQGSFGPNHNLPYWPDQQIGVVTEPIGGITPQDGGYFLVQKGAYPLPTDGIWYRGPLVQMPTITGPAIQQLSGTMNWAEALVAPGTRGKIELRFERPSGDQVILAETPARSGSETHSGWQTTAPVINNNPYPLSGEVGHLVIRVEGGTGAQRVGIDNFKVSLNGRPISLTSAQPIPPYQNGGACPSCTHTGLSSEIVGDPVNTRSGAFVERAIDQRIETDTTDLIMSRTYVSGLTDATSVRQGSLGAGWRAIYEERLTFPDQVGGERGTVIYEANDGNRYPFFKGATSFQAGIGIRSRLVPMPDGGYQLIANDTSIKAFDAQGRLVALIDPQGRSQSITLHLNGALQGYPLAISDDLSGRSLSFGYTTISGVGVRLQTVADDLNQVTTYEYDATGDLTWVTTPQGQKTWYQTDANGLILGVSKGLTTADTTLSRRDIVNTYTLGKITQQVERSGLVWTYAYETTPQGQPQTRIQRWRGTTLVDTQVVHYRRDGTVAWIERNNAFVSYRTNDQHLAANQISNGNGTVALQTTNAVGLPTSESWGVITSAGIQPIGAAKTTQYDANNRPTTITEPTGVVQTRVYHSNGQPSSIQYGTQSATLYTYDPVTNKRATVTTPDGVVTKYSYTAAGQISLVEVGFGTSAVQKTAYGYDILGRMTDVTIGFGTALATTTHTDYRPDGLVWKETQNYVNGGTPSTATQNLVTEYGYDSYGRQIWTKGPDGRYRNVTSYDAAGRVRWVVENALNGSGVPTLPSFSGNPPSFSPSYPTGNIATFYGYDSLGRTILVTETGILTGTFNPSTLLWSGSTTRMTRTEYDALSRPVTTTLNYRPDINGGQFSPQYADVNVQTLTYYDGASNITWTRDELRRWTRIEYDALSRPVTTTLNYENGNPLTIDSMNNSWATLTDTDIVQVKRYDSAGRADRTIENYVDGVQATAVANPTLPWQISDVMTDRMTLTTFDALGRVTDTTRNSVAGSVLAELNQSTGTAYASNGRVQATRDVTGQWTVPQYDGLGRVTKSIQNCRNAGGTKVSSNCSTQTSDRNVATAESRFDALGRTYEVVETNGTVTRIAYDALNRITSVTQNYQNGVTPTVTINVATTTTYADALGLTVTSTDPTGKATISSRNLDTGVTTVTAPSGLITRTGPRWTKTPDGQVSVSMIDGLGRIVQQISNYQDGVVTGADGTTRDLISRTQYDVAGRTIAIIDSIGTVTRSSYDLSDNLVQVIENADGVCSQVEASDCQVTTQYRYDRAGNQTAVINGRGITSRVMRYDALDQLRNQEDALRNGTSTSYTVRGAVASVQPSGASAITTSYDELGRPISKTGANGASQTWTYDTVGRLYSAFDASAQDTANGKTGVLIYTYDVLNRVTGVHQSLANDPTAGTWMLGYSYDAAGRVTLIGGNSYSYDSAGRLQTIGRGGFTIAQYSYNSTTGWVDTLTRSETDASRAVETTQYDALGRVSSITVNGATGTGATPTAQLAQYSYIYDRASRPVTFTESQLNSSGTTVTENHSYGYDNVGRLASETAGSTTTGYGYDRAGNRVRVGGTTVSYLNNDRRSGWTYDAAGNVLTNGTQSYSYDGFNRPTTVTAGGVNYTYRYHEESLVSRHTNGTLTHAYLTDRVGTPYSSLLRVTNFAGADQYVTTYVSGLDGTILHQDQLKNGANNGKSFLIGDTQRTVRMAINSTTGARGTQDSDAWGKALTTPISPIRYAGEFSDAQTGLVFLRARWYNPTNGVFLSVDPFAGYAQQPLSLNPYQYAYNSPLMYVDPSGRIAIFVGGKDSDLYNPYDPVGAPGIFRLGFRVQNTYAWRIRNTSWLGWGVLKKEIDPFRGKCNTVPVVLVGHSLGAGTVMEFAHYYDDAPIDLIVTLGTVVPPWASVFNSISKPENAAIQYHYVSDPDSDWRTYGEIQGVSNATVVRYPGITHTSMDEEDLPNPSRPNPIWLDILGYINTIHQKYFSGVDDGL